MAAAVGVIDEEVRRFAALGDEWWNPAGPMAALHRLNPTRMAWLRDAILNHFGREAKGAAPPLAGLTLLDVGCGGGLAAEPLARLGAEVTGLDPAPESIAVARAHAEATGVRLAYRAGLVEHLVAEAARFDVVTALEVVEHVADLRAFVAAAAALAKARRPRARFDPQPHPEELRAGDCRGRVPARLGGEGDASLGAVRHPGRTRRRARGRRLQRDRRAAASSTIRLRRDWRLSSDVSVNYFMGGEEVW